MWTKLLIALLAFATVGCGSNSSNQSITINDTLADGTVVQRKSANNTNENSATGSGFWEKLVMVELKDANGVIAAIMPFPASWKIGASITGPNGIKVTEFPIRSFMNNYNPQLQQSYA
ncbi:MAG: hypothetical protein WAR80_03230, partial [Ferruginibacter sp.]